MKILMMGVQKLAIMPYMNFYLSQLDFMKHDVHLLYWNRDCQQEKIPDYPITFHEFSCYQEDEVPKITKINSFRKYRKFAKELLEKEQFDFIIVLNTITGILVQDLLYGKYAKRYIFDYRDPTQENIKAYKYMVGMIVKNSKATFVSSDGFRKLLPDEQHIYTSHNLLLDSLHHRNVRKSSPRETSPIRIRFWGMIRNESINKLMIDRLANDSRFELHYHGRMQKTGKALKTYCQDQNIHNVHFHGEYSPSDRYSFAKETDLLHNLYENDKVMVGAMANKFYDGIVHYIPQLCSKGSFMGQKTADYQVGLAIDPHDPALADQIYAYYQQINWPAFQQRCDSSLQEVLNEYQAANDMIHAALNEDSVSLLQAGRKR